MRTGVLTTAVVLLATGVSDAAAQRLDSPYRFVQQSQAAGIYAAVVSPSAGRLGLGPQDAQSFGVRYGISLGGPVTVELDLLYAPTTRAVGDTALTVPDSLPTILGNANMRLLVGTGSIRFNITGARTWHGLQPFLVFGGGLATDVAAKSALADSVPADARFDFGTSFAGQFGAGLEWYPSERWSVRVDARNALWKLKYPAAFRLGERGQVIPPDEWDSNFIISLGLSYRF